MIDLVERLSPLLPWTTWSNIAYCYGDAQYRVALGFARTRAGVGGVRNHLNCIERHSRHEVTLMPSSEMCRRAAARNQWAAMTDAVCDLPLHRFGVVHSHVNASYVTACSNAAQKGVPWIHTYHTMYFPEDWGGTLAPWQEAINHSLLHEASKADVRISISPWLSKLLEERHGISTIVIPNGVDAEKCDNAIPIQQHQGFEGYPPYVLFSGSLSEVKNPRLFIQLAQRNPELVFVMIGKNLEPDSVREFHGSDLPTNLRLLGPMDHGLALSFTKSASALVVTSHSEGLPTAVMEAMAMGKPVVVPDSFGCKDLVTSGETGFVFEPNDLDSLSEQFQLSLGNEAIGINAERLMREHYAWPRVIDRLDEVYASVLK